MGKLIWTGFGIIMVIIAIYSILISNKKHQKV